ncbi:MAG: beta-galactosidase, partial [Caldilineaceae bacterium]
MIVAGFLFWRNWQMQVPLGPQQQVSTSNPKVGIHTRLTDEVEPWKVKRTLEMVREMGSPWIVEYFPWAYGEPRPGQYDWSHSDLVIDHATRQGLTVIARLGFVPEWARPAETTPLYLSDDSFDDFGRFAAAFAVRYADRIDYLIIGNEPNLALEWGYQAPDAARYTELLRIVYPLVKQAAPEMQVLAGALAPTNAPPDSADAVNDLVFLQQMYDAGAADYFDVLAIHAYGWHA